MFTTHILLYISINNIALLRPIHAFQTHTSEFDISIFIYYEDEEEGRDRVCVCVCVCVCVEEDSNNELNLCMYIYISQYFNSCAIPPHQIPEC